MQAYRLSPAFYSTLWIRTWMVPLILIGGRLAFVKEIESRGPLAGYLQMLQGPLAILLSLAVAGGAFAAPNAWVKLSCCLALLAFVLKYGRQEWPETTLGPNVQKLRQMGMAFISLMAVLNGVVAILALVKG